MQKTLGGDRLGSGKKMKVDLHGYERSTHNISYLWRSTMSAGTLVPFLSEVALPGDTFDIKLGCEIMTHPTRGPLFGSYKVQLDIFQAPIRLYNALLHNNALGIGLTMSEVKLPQIRLTSPVQTGLELDTTDVDNSQINPSCILSYLGIRGVGGNTTAEPQERLFNAIGILAYWDIYKNYYANKQEEIGAVIHTPSATLVETVDSIEISQPPYTLETVLPQVPSGGALTLAPGTRILINYTGTTPLPIQILFNTSAGQLNGVEVAGFIDMTTHLQGLYSGTAYGTITVYSWQYIDNNTPNQGTPQVATFPLVNLDNMRKAILKYDTPGTPFVINDVTVGIEPYIWLDESNDGIPNKMSSQEGLGLKTYQSDLFNNWLQTEWIDGTSGITAVTAIDTSGGSFTLDTLLLARKVYDMLNRIAVSGGTYDDWLDAVYDHPRYLRCETPMYMGGLIKELVFQEVISNSASEAEPLGTLAGRGVMTDKHKGGDVIIKVDEPSYILGIISLTPRLDYSQGNKWDVNLETLDELHKPGLDEIGFQELITEQMAWWSTEWDDANSIWVQKSAGKQPAWINYMTNVNQTRGNFAIRDNEMFMTLNRRYEFDEPGSGWNIVDLTTYIDPSKFNFIFAETALDAQNFWAQIAIDITARRKMSAKIMPNL